MPALRTKPSSQTSRRACVVVCTNCVDVLADSNFSLGGPHLKLKSVMQVSGVVAHRLSNMQMLTTLSACKTIARSREMTAKQHVEKADAMNRQNANSARKNGKHRGTDTNGVCEAVSSVRPAGKMTDKHGLHGRDGATLQSWPSLLAASPRCYACAINKSDEHSTSTIPPTTSVQLLQYARTREIATATHCSLVPEIRVWAL